ncbi:MAG: tetratricopeptide repeat protein [Candidatus Heimdallarchaeota archaeon]|nr:tetratricopeptide repeat protein [Candidatus Heimdallarchaeota archaeon]
MSGQIDQAVDMEKKTIPIIQSKSFISRYAKRAKSHALNQMGASRIMAGDLKTAHAYFKESKDLSEEIEDWVNYNMTQRNLGLIYSNMGQHPEALELMEENLRNEERISNEDGVAHAKVNLASLYYISGRLQEAANYGRSAMEFRFVQKNKMRITESLPHQVRIYELLNQKTNSREIYEIAGKIIGPDENPFIKAGLKHAEALILKNSNRARHKTNSQTILEELLADPILKTRSWWLSSAKLDLCDLLVEELSQYGEQEVLDEITSYLQAVENDAMMNHDYRLELSTALIRSRLNLIEGDHETALEKLEEVSIRATETQHTIFIQQAEDEKLKIVEEIKKWPDLISPDTTMRQKIRNAKLEEYLQNALSVASKLS